MKIFYKMDVNVSRRNRNLLLGIFSWLKHNQEMVIKVIMGITHNLCKHAQCHTQWNYGLCVFIQSWFSDYDKIISQPVYTLNITLVPSISTSMITHTYTYRNLSFLSHQQFPFHSCFDFRPTTYNSSLGFCQLTTIQLHHVQLRRRVSGWRPRIGGNVHRYPLT